MEACISFFRSQALEKKGCRRLMQSLIEDQNHFSIEHPYIEFPSIPLSPILCALFPSLGA
jgi:hypothetical protein